MPMQFVVRGSRKPRPRPSGVLVHGLSQEEIETYNAEHPESHRFRTPGKVYENLEYFDTLVEETSTRFSQSLDEVSLKQMRDSVCEDEGSEAKTRLSSPATTTAELDTDMAASKLPAAQPRHQASASNEEAEAMPQQQHQGTAATRIQAAHQGRRSRRASQERAAAAVEMQAAQRAWQTQVVEYERAEVHDLEKKARTVAAKVQAVHRGSLTSRELLPVCEEASRRSSMQAPPTTVAQPVVPDESVVKPSVDEAQIGAPERSITENIEPSADDEAAAKLQAITRGYQARISQRERAVEAAALEVTATAVATPAPLNSVERGTQTVNEPEKQRVLGGVETSASAEQSGTDAMYEPEDLALAPMPAANDMATDDKATVQEFAPTDSAREALVALVADATQAAVAAWVADKEVEAAQAIAVAEAAEPVYAATAPSTSASYMPGVYHLPKDAADAPASKRAATEILGAQAAKGQGSQTARLGKTPAYGLGPTATKDQGSQTARPAQTLAGARKPAAAKAAKRAVHAAAKPVTAAAAVAAVETAVEAFVESTTEEIAEPVASAARKQVAAAATEQVAAAAAAEAYSTRGSTTPRAEAASQSTAENDAEAADDKAADPSTLSIALSDTLSDTRAQMEKLPLEFVAADEEPNETQAAAAPPLPELSKPLSDLLVSMFSRIDINGNGTISKSEAIEFWGANYAKINAAAMFNEVDVDMSGDVSESEWIDFWKNVLAQGYNTEKNVMEEIQNMMEGSSWVGWRDGRSTAARIS